MNVTISTTEFTANTVTEAQVTFDGSGTCYIGTELSGLLLGTEPNRFSDFIQIEPGTTTIYVRPNIVAGSYPAAIGWAYLAGDHYEEGSWDITVTGDPPKYENIGFSLSPRAATVQYNANLVNSPVRVGRTLTGSILDHQYGFEVERVTEQGARAAVAGAAYATALVYKLITYKVEYEFELQYLGWRRPKLTDHLAAISSAIGIPITFIGADFYPKTDINIQLRKGLSMSFYEQLGGSFGEILNRLIGWSDTVPSMTHNVYVDNGRIYIIERGYEQNTLTPANWILTPTLTHSIRRTEWADSAYQTVVPKQISSSDAANSNEPYSGTISWGTASLTYQDGYLVSETDGNCTTTYTYTDMDTGKRLQMKETVDTDAGTYIKTTYSYESTETDYYLSEEITETYDGQDATGVLEDRVKTIHVPLGGGWYGTTTYDMDGEETANSVSQGAPSGKVSQYTIDAQNDALKPAGSQRQMVVPLTGVARARQTYPVADLATLQKIAGILNNLEGREEITLSGEIVGGNHIYNYNDKIVYNGNTYYLVNNQVTQNYNTIRQSITAVRWV